MNDPAKWDSHIRAIRETIQELSNLTKKNISDFFPQQYNEVMDMLKRAYTQDENNSLLLLARSKQTLHALTSQVEKDIIQYMRTRNDYFDLKVIRVNSTMNNSEPKI